MVCLRARYVLWGLCGRGRGCDDGDGGGGYGYGCDLSLL